MSKAFVSLLGDGKRIMIGRLRNDELSKIADKNYVVKEYSIVHDIDIICKRLSVRKVFTTVAINEKCIHDILELKQHGYMVGVGCDGCARKFEEYIAMVSSYATYQDDHDWYYSAIVNIIRNGYNRLNKVASDILVEYMRYNNVIKNYSMQMSIRVSTGSRCALNIGSEAEFKRAMNVRQVEHIGYPGVELLRIEYGNILCIEVPYYVAESSGDIVKQFEKYLNGIEKIVSKLRKLKFDTCIAGAEYKEISILYSVDNDKHIDIEHAKMIADIVRDAFGIGE